MEEQIVFDDEMMPVTLPDNFQSAPPGLSTTLPAVDNIEAAIERAQDYHGKDASMVFVKYPILACRQ